jgi:hypothetical protein
MRPPGSGISTVFGETLHVVNIGLNSFAESIAQAGGSVTHVDWQPPAAGDAEVGRRLADLINLPEVEEANLRAFRRYLDASPILEAVKPAREAIPELKDRLILHAGPPIEWGDMCGPMQGAITGAIMLEGWADSAQAAAALAASGEIAFAPCHHYGAVGPMAGIVSPSMPVWSVVTGSKRTYSTLNEGLGRVLRYGANSPEVIARLHWMGAVLGPSLNRALAATGGVELKPLIGQSLHMGDELHNRNGAATSLLLKRLLPPLLEGGQPSHESAAIVRFIAGNDHFFLNISMAACKAMLDAAHGVPGSSLITVMARNGVEFGIRMSGTGDQWFTAPAPRINGLYFPNYGPDDAAPDLGDSAITETAGLGGFAMAAAPAIVQFVGGTPADAEANTLRMMRITVGKNPAFSIPSLGFSGTPAGIDARKVVDRGIAPVINTGIAHRRPGIGQIGAGITQAPMACFSQAIVALAEDFTPRS